MATHIPSTGTHARERSRFAFAEAAHPRIIAPGGPVSMAVHAMSDDAVTHINTARLVRLADSVAGLNDRLDVLMVATGAGLRPALESLVDSLIEALDHLDRDFDIEDDEREHDEAERGIADFDGAGEQGFCPVAYGAWA